MKLGAHRVGEGASTLKRFEQKMVEHGAASPAFMAVLVSGGIAHTREDGIHVVPLDCLRD